MSKNLYDAIEDRLVRIIYPELCRIISEKNLGYITIDKLEGYADTKITEAGEMFIWVNNPHFNPSRIVTMNNPTHIWALLGSILGTQCPRRQRIESTNSMHTYIEYADRILFVTQSFRNERKNIAKFLSEADMVENEMTREIITEKKIN